MKCLYRVKILINGKPYRESEVRGKNAAEARRKVERYWDSAIYYAKQRGDDVTVKARRICEA